LLRYSQALAPKRKTLWAEAMAREREEIADPGEALAFAVGCFVTISIERARTIEFLLNEVRWAVSAATGLLAIIALIAVLRMSSAYSQAAIVLGAIGVVFGCCSYLLANRKESRVAWIAVGMFALSGVSSVALSTAFPELRHEVFYRALALEGLVLWSAVLGASLAIATGRLYQRLTINSDCGEP
jgi:hypothetical protein